MKTLIPLAFLLLSPALVHASDGKPKAHRQVGYVQCDPSSVGPAEYQACLAQQQARETLSINHRSGGAQKIKSVLGGGSGMGRARGGHHRRSHSSRRYGRH
jgi:hypothetical protein